MMMKTHESRQAREKRIAFQIALVGILAGVSATGAFATGLGCVSEIKDCPQTCTAPDAQCPKKCNVGSQSTCVCETVSSSCICVEVVG